MWVTGVKSTEGYINNLYQQRAIFTKTCERKRPDTVTSSYKKKHACFFPTDFLFHFMLMWCYHFPWLAFASFIVMYSSFFQVPLWCASYFASSIEACFLVLHYDILLVFFSPLSLWGASCFYQFLWHWGWGSSAGDLFCLWITKWKSES